MCYRSNAWRFEFFSSNLRRSEQAIVESWFQETLSSYRLESTRFSQNFSKTSSVSSQWERLRIWSDLKFLISFASISIKETVNMFFLRDKCLRFLAFLMHVSNYRLAFSFIFSEFNSKTSIWHCLSPNNFFSEKIAYSLSISMSSNIKVLHEPIFNSPSTRDCKP